MSEGIVYEVFRNKFKIGTKGLASADSDMVVIKGLSTFSPSFESNVVEFNPLEAEGFGDAMVTGKKITIALSGQRVYGDPGNDYVAGLAIKTGNDVVTKFEWVFPDGAKLSFDCVIATKTIAGGEATALNALEADVTCKGKPVYTPAPTQTP